MMTTAATVPAMHNFIFMFSHQNFFLSRLPVCAKLTEAEWRFSARLSKSDNLASRSITRSMLFRMMPTTSSTCRRLASILSSGCFRVCLVPSCSEFGSMLKQLKAKGIFDNRN